MSFYRSFVLSFTLPSLRGNFPPSTRSPFLLRLCCYSCNCARLHFNCILLAQIQMLANTTKTGRASAAATCYDDDSFRSECVAVTGDALERGGKSHNTLMCGACEKCKPQCDAATGETTECAKGVCAQSKSCAVFGWPEKPIKTIRHQKRGGNSGTKRFGDASPRCEMTKVYDWGPTPQGVVL